jgi:hypothetical protein
MALLIVAGGLRLVSDVEMSKYRHPASRRHRRNGKPV